ncbi:hypothetical protein FA10DRAFT_264276 [Acaromyces ingoldii]|uniref:Uncharacterized protein n=1 Tax=Acaromyces ingoldii TaxID=215250 RepID=A0A316Z042_9BASI|nr:hypothetical protein FA10DRAFT_264276 [Acaromyces ingoldii]PWN93653.1 hypothetical protein FA10DRAFT_264276 [Acaromyces ingoldii]
MDLLETPPTSPIAFGQGQRWPQPDFDCEGWDKGEELDSFSEDSDSSSIYCPSRSSGYQSVDEDEDEEGSVDQSRTFWNSSSLWKATKGKKKQSLKEGTLPPQGSAPQSASKSRKSAKAAGKVSFAYLESHVAPPLSSSSEEKRGERRRRAQSKACARTSASPPRDPTPTTSATGRSDSLKTLKQRWESIYERCTREIELGLPDDEILFLPHRVGNGSNGKNGRQGKEDGDNGDDDYGLIIIDNNGRLSSIESEAEFGKLLKRESTSRYPIEQGGDVHAEKFQDQLASWIGGSGGGVVEGEQQHKDVCECMQGEAMRRWRRRLSERISSVSSSNAIPTIKPSVDADLEDFLREDARLRHVYGSELYEDGEEEEEVVDFGEHDWTELVKQRDIWGSRSSKAQRFTEMPPTPSPTPPRSNSTSTLSSHAVHRIGSPSPSLERFEEREGLEYIDRGYAFPRTPSRKHARTTTHSPSSGSTARRQKRKRGSHDHVIHLPDLLKEEASPASKREGSEFLRLRDLLRPDSDLASSAHCVQTRRRRRGGDEDPFGTRHKPTTPQGLACAGPGQCRKALCLLCAGADE